MLLFEKLHFFGAYLNINRGMFVLYIYEGTTKMTFWKLYFPKRYDFSRQSLRQRSDYVQIHVSRNIDGTCSTFVHGFAMVVIIYFLESC